MPIPYRFNPMGKNEKKYFELIVKPGILANAMAYGFTPYWNSGGYCSVDWGDGQKEDATKSRTKLNHTYVVAGTYKIKIKAECYHIIFGGYSILYDCYEKWDSLGSLIGSSGASQVFDTCRNLVHTFNSLPSTLRYGYCMFRNCSKADFIFETLPDGLVNGGYMFYGCSKATLPLTSLPAGLSMWENAMFYNCTNAELPLTSLPDGLTNGDSMFYGCTKAQLPLTSLPERLKYGQKMFCLCRTAKFSFVSLPESLTNGSSMFDSCNNAELPLTSLPSALTNGDNMFSGCGNAQLPLTSLPEGLTTAYGMFYVCRKAEIKLTKLPSELTNCYRMFQYCTNAEINLDTLVANAPAEGWTKLTDITNMFNGCSKVTGSRSAFLAKCPANVVGADTAFLGTNTTE